MAATEKTAKKPGGMNLAGVRLVKETPEAWHVHDGTSEFRVSKKVSPFLRNQITQHFAAGGEAGPVPASDAAPPPAPFDPGQWGTPVDLTPRPIDWKASPDEVAAAELRAGIAGGATPPAPVDPAALRADVAGSPIPPAPPSSSDMLSSHAPSVPAPGGEMLPSHVPLGSVPAMLSAHTPGTAYVPPERPVAAAPASGGSAPGSGVQQEIIKSYRTAEAAETAKADVAKREAAQALIVQQQNDQARQELTNNWTSTWQKWQSDGDEIRRSILDQKIDPTHYWASKSTGGKIRSVIGILLGGIGAGAGNTENMAMGVIRDAINRDVDAQKAELGKKQSLLSMHMEQGHTLQASYQLARADMLDAAAAHVQMVATQFAGDKAQAGAQSSIAALQRDAAVTRQQVAAQGLQMSLNGVQLEQAKMGVAMSRMQMGALQALTAPPGQEQPGQSGQRPTLGTRIDPRAIAFLPEDFQKKIVSLPDGSYAMARDVKGKEEVDKSIEAAGTLQDKMRRYSALLAKHPHGVFSTTDPTDYATAQALHESILTDINSLAGLNRFTETEKGIYLGRVPDITSKQFRGTPHQAKLSELQQEIADKVQRSVAQYLNLPRRTRIQ